ncbi:LacI family DNA-binding transcriptional regulator [Paenibacillus sp. GCM10023248]|uniref:LacI family DNA-binding transcriptional regulator n=1 Tax=unclassified Paenibacillus TaxID=185978 RepID=UPI002379A3D7|nr:LacI family DNA-binding transcriptional regulator [Paenibacillus sp. MAHUQ-63]MDD9268987.1 LacI family DNA-binding transcriptional regulator [Paenibacillus sp. MAHUQ-63]
MNVTSKQIAELCGVTRGTVDRALNNRPGISAETRDKIMRVAEELGYRPHFLAQSLVKGHTKTLGIVLFDIHNQIFSQLFHAFEAEARRRGYIVYLVLSHRDKELEWEYINNLLDRRVDGIALLPANDSKKFESFLLRSRTPIVTFGNRLTGPFPYIWIHDKQAIHDSVSYLAGQGYRHLIYISPPLMRKGKENIYVPEQRYQGFISACVDIPDMRFDVIAQKHYLSELEALLDRTDSKCAILCSSDVYALDVLKWLKARKIRVPEQVGLMGFDNIDVLKYINPSLTTVDYNVNEIGTQLADLLIRRINDTEVPAETLIAHHVLPGESVAQSPG